MLLLIIFTIWIFELIYIPHFVLKISFPLSLLFRTSLNIIQQSWKPLTKHNWQKVSHSTHSLWRKIIHWEWSLLWWVIPRCCHPSVTILYHLLPPLRKKLQSTFKQQHNTFLLNTGKNIFLAGAWNLRVQTTQFTDSWRHLCHLVCKSICYQCKRLNYFLRSCVVS